MRLCIESMSSGGKAKSGGDRSISVLEAQLANCTASMKVLEEKIKELTEDKRKAEAARDWALAQGRDLQSQLDKWREARGQQPHST